MRTKHLCVLIHIRTKGVLGTDKLVKALQLFLITDCSKGVFLLCIYLLLMFPACLCNADFSGPCILVLTCWERPDLLAPLCVMFSCDFVTFAYGVVGQVWYLIVLIPDLCLPLYFKWVNNI